MNRRTGKSGSGSPGRHSKSRRTARTLHVLLAEEAESRKEALQHLREGRRRGGAALGPAVFEQAAGNFWELVETPPVHAARECLAHFLWTMGRATRRIAHLQDMLRLNPKDHQRVRFILSAWLISEGRT